MSKTRRFVSLRVKLIIILAVALLVAAAVFALVREFGNFMVWRYYLDEETKNERAVGYIKDFQQYVKENKLLTTDSDKINSWSAGGYVEMIFYKDSNLIYAPEWFEKMENEKNNAEEKPDVGEGDEPDSPEGEQDPLPDDETDTPLDEETLADGVAAGDLKGGAEDAPENSWLSGDRGFKQYLSAEERAAYLELLEDILDGNRELSPVEFVDGTLLVTVVDYTEDFLSGVVFAVALLAALVVLSIIMIFNFTGMATRINRLAHKVKLVESGNLELAIEADGNDEITALACDVNSMRNSVVDNMTKEKQAWEANTELITAMSHDVRTPLTVMLGYLDLMELQNTDPASDEYIAACKENALKLKRLSDDMFSYFLVFGKNDSILEEIVPQSTDFIKHMIAEHELLLVESGYLVERENDMPEVKVMIDTVYFGRVIDNVFSNIGKYADNAEPIRISSAFDGKRLEITFKNKIKRNYEHAESNHIGIKTCMRIMEKLGGGFESSSTSDSFVARVIIPAEK